LGRRRDIPFVMIQHHPVFHRVELLEWAIDGAGATGLTKASPRSPPRCSVAVGGHSPIRSVDHDGDPDLQSGASGSAP
jgi:hypothetical protein